MDFKEVDLPSGRDIHKVIRKVKDSDLKTCEDLRKFLFEKSDILVDVMDEFISAQEYVEDPEVVVDRLLNYHYINSGLLGLAVALERHIRSLHFKDYGDPGKPKMAETAKAEMSKGAVADIEGIVTLLERWDRNLNDRIQLQKGNLRKTW